MSPSDHELMPDKDRLSLLQLQAKRAIAERRASTPGELVGEDSGGTTAQLPQPLERWQLVPESEPLHAWQSAALPIWLDQGRGTVKVATGGGKTRFALLAAQELQRQRVPDLRLVIVVPTIPLLFQWQTELEQSNLPPSAIGLMGGGEETPPLDSLQVLICVLASARDRLPALIRSAGWSERMLLVVDECHRANADQARRIFESSPAYTLGLSATPEDEDEDTDFPSDEAYARSPVGQALGLICYQFSLKESLEAGLLTPFEIWHVGLPMSEAEAAQHSKLSREISDLRKQLEAAFARSRSRQPFIAWCQTMASRASGQGSEAQRFIGLTGERKRLLYRCAARRALTLAVLRDGLGDVQSRAIVFHESIDEVEEIFLDVLDAGLPAVLEHSKLPDRLRAESIDAFRRGIARAIVSAKSLVEGFNVPSADLGVIVASSGSVRQRIQSLGRMLRRKESARPARVWVFYVRESEDEIIYQRTDWDHVVGASVNRYFHWDPSLEGEDWRATLVETQRAPRRFRPASRDVDVTGLAPRSPYAGRDDGRDLKVDQQGNARFVDSNALLPLAPPSIGAVLELNRYRRAHLTRAGHLIVRTSDDTSAEGAWLFLGTAQAEEPSAAPGERVELKLVSRSGIRRLALKSAGGERYALGPADRITALFAWVAQVEAAENGLRVSKVCWNREQRFWIEAAGRVIDWPGEPFGLEFAE